MRGADLSGVAVLCRVSTHLCALPIEHIVETMRPVPAERVADMPSFVLGLSVIRGNAVPVVHAARLLGAVEVGPPARFLTLRVADRLVALAVDEVVGVRDLSAVALADVPPLLQEASGDVVSAIGTLDSALLLLLRGARIVPVSVWEALGSRGGA